jgi:DNA polymerase-1
MKPTTKEAYELFHNATLTFADMEHAGIRVNTQLLNQTQIDTESQIRQLTGELIADPIYSKWRSKFGAKAKLGSREQLSEIAFKVMKWPVGEQRLTQSGKQTVDESTFAHLQEPFIKKYFRLQKLSKLNGTYLKGIAREVQDGFLHPSFNLHLVETYRSSSDGPNFQNIPIRDPIQGEAIRACFIPRDGHCIAEIDYGMLEFRIAASFWKDKSMIEYASDPTKDVHKDQACEIFLCKPDQVSKTMRHVAKNMFVFPILYGSYYVQCSKNIWEEVLGGLKMQDGSPVSDWLASKGIKDLGLCQHKERPKDGTMEKHIKKVEDNFNKKFPGFGDNKDKWWESYVKRGYFQTMTGFELSGIFSKNFLMNAPIQGPGFHGLAWSATEINKWRKKAKRQFKLIGQIHDCILLDIPHGEVQEVLHKCKEVMTKDLCAAWDWIKTPMEVEVDIVAEGKSWKDKAPLIIKDGNWIKK